MRLHHPDYYKTGTRILLLKGRRKDGEMGHQRAISRISHDEVHFNRYLEELSAMRAQSERIYATSSARDMKKAQYLFEHRQIEARQAGQEENFYQNLESRWISCAMKPECEAQPRTWLWDCDSPEDLSWVTANVMSKPGVISYMYDTKNGTHVITNTFDLWGVRVGLLHRNPLMLWEYENEPQ